MILSSLQSRKNFDICWSQIAALTLILIKFRFQNWLDSFDINIKIVKIHVDEFWCPVRATWMLMARRFIQVRSVSRCRVFLPVRIDGRRAGCHGEAVKRHQVRVKAISFESFIHLCYFGNQILFSTWFWMVLQNNSSVNNLLYWFWAITYWFNGLHKWHGCI